MSIVATTHPETADLLGARFDWYACTVNASVDGLKAVLVGQLGGEWKPQNGARHGFHNREVLELLDGTVGATMLHGGNGDLPHVYASGDACDEFVRIIRANYGPRRDPVTGKMTPLHKVSRMDAALDYDGGDNTFSQLLDQVTSIAKGERVEGDTRRRVKTVSTNQMGDWLTGKKGRTFYLGSFKSAVLVRLYEKGKQLRQDAEMRGKPRYDLSDNLTRLECQVRPDGAAKEKAATATPLEAFGYAEWSRELLRRVEAQDVERVNIRERRESDLDRALNWMVKQYGDHILTEVENVGGWSQLGKALRRRMETGETTPEDERPF